MGGYGGSESRYQCIVHVKGKRVCDFCQSGKMLLNSGFMKTINLATIIYIIYAGLAYIIISQIGGAHTKKYFNSLPKFGCVNPHPQPLNPPPPPTELFSLNTVCLISIYFRDFFLIFNEYFSNIMCKLGIWEILTLKKTMTLNTLYPYPLH